MRGRGNKGVFERSKSSSHIIHGSLITQAHSRCSQSRLGFRSLSYDSVFTADLCQLDPEQPLSLSPENIHAKIKALQKKLQKQKMHLGPQPMVIPAKHTEDSVGRPEHHLENLELYKNLQHKSQVSQSSFQADVPQPISSTLPPLFTSEVDFSTSPQFIRCLDNSAARHRMSIKPRNQRASTKNRRMPASPGSRPRSESISILEHPITKREEVEMTWARANSAKIIRTGESFIAPSNKSLLSASPLKSRVGSEDNYCPSAVSQHIGIISPTISKQHHIQKPQSPALAATHTNRAEVVLRTQLDLKSVEGTTVKQLVSVMPTSPTGSGDQRKIPYSSKISSLQDNSVSTVTTAHLSSVDSDQNQPEVEKETNTITTPDRNKLNNSFTQETKQTDNPKQPPQRPPLLHRNASLFDKVDSKDVEKILLPFPSKEGQLQMEFPSQQRPVLMSLCTSASSAKIYEGEKIENITQAVEQAGSKRESAFPPSLNIKSQEQFRGSEKLTGKDLSEAQVRAAGTSSIRTMPAALTTLSIGLQKGHNSANHLKKIKVEAEKGEVLQELDDSSKYQNKNEFTEEEKETEERKDFGIKLRTTSLSLKFHADKAQSKGKVKQHTPEVHNLITQAVKGQEMQDSMALTALKNPQIHNTQSLIYAQVPHFQPQSAIKFQEATVPCSQPDLGPSALPLPSSMKAFKEQGPPTSLIENNLMQTSTKEPRGTFTELSWIEMAREKTRSLQQLFTSKLTDLAGLQTVTCPAASPQTQTSSQLSASSVRSVCQLSTDQSSVRPLHPICTQPPTTETSLKATHQTLTQPPAMQSSTRSLPFTDQSGTVHFSFKHAFSTTIQAQTPQVRPNQMSASNPITAHLATKLAQSTESHEHVTQFDPHTIHTTQFQFSQIPINQPIQQSLTHTVTKTQAYGQLNLFSDQPTSFNLSLSPKDQPSQISPSPISQHRPQIGRGLFSTPSEQTDLALIPQGKGPIDDRIQWAPETMSKALPVEQRQFPKHDADEANNQKSPLHFQDSRQDVDEYRAMYSHSQLTEFTAMSDPMRMDKEMKCSKKTVLPSSPSSSPLESLTDSGQPSWMELAKRKSLAWSDKIMD